MLLNTAESLIVKFETAINANDLEVSAEISSQNYAFFANTPNENLTIFSSNSNSSFVEKIWVSNTDTVSHVLEVIRSIEGSDTTLVRYELESDQTLQYVRGNGFNVCCDNAVINVDIDGMLDSESFTVNLVANTPLDVDATNLTKITSIEIIRSDDRLITDAVEIDILTAPVRAVITSNQNLNNVEVILSGEK